jgi:hypothetical protein
VEQVRSERRGKREHQRQGNERLEQREARSPVKAISAARSRHRQYTN